MGIQVRLAPHDPSRIPPGFADAGEGCLRVDVLKAGAYGLSNYAFPGPHGDIGRRFTPGTYRAEVWLRREGLGQGEVAFSVPAAEPVLWQVEGNWVLPQ